MPAGADRERSEHRWFRVPGANRTRCQASDGLSDCVLGPWRGRTADRDDPEPDEHGRDPGQLDGRRAVPGDDRRDDTRERDEEEGRSEPHQGNAVEQPDPGDVRETRSEDAEDEQPGQDRRRPTDGAPPLEQGWHSRSSWVYSDPARSRSTKGSEPCHPPPPPVSAALAL